MTASIFNVFNRKAVNGGSLSASRWKLKYDNQCGHNLSVSEHLLRLLPFAKFMLNCQLCWRWDLTAACDYSTDAVSYGYGISSHISIARKVHINSWLYENSFPGPGQICISLFISDAIHIISQSIDFKSNLQHNKLLLVEKVLKHYTKLSLDIISNVIFE